MLHKAENISVFVEACNSKI